MAVESYVIIEKILEDSCEQTMEFVSKNEKDKPCQTDLPLLKTISQILSPLLGCWIQSSKHRFEADNFKLKNYGIYYYT